MEKSTERYKIILVDDHTLFRNGLKGLLNRYPECEVVGEASDGMEFLELLEKTPCDIVLLDIDMPRMNGIEAVQRALARYPELKVVTLSMHGDEEYYFRMVEAGIKGFLLKNSEIDEVRAAVTAAGSGGSYFSQELLRSLVGSLKSSTPGQTADQDTETLSERETEVLLGICKGLSNQEIADELFISKRTVDKHRANILDKTGCRNTANLVVYAIKNSLVKI